MSKPHDTLRRLNALALISGGHNPSFNQVAFTQSLGAELLTDGGVENWLSATDLTSWTESLTGTSTVNREGTDMHSGSFAVRLDIDAGNGIASIIQTIAVNQNDFVEKAWWAKSSVALKTARFAMSSELFTPATTWQQHMGLERAPSNNPQISYIRNSATNSSQYGDDFSVKKITLNATQIGTANAENIFSFILPASPIAGQRVSMRYRVNATTPALDYWNAYLIRNDGNTAWDFKLDSVSSGTATNRISVTGVGTPDAVRVIANGTLHDAYTGVAGAYTQRGAQINVSHQDTSTGVLAVYSTGVTPISLISYPLA